MEVVDPAKLMTFETAADLTEAGEIDAGRWVPVTKNTYRHGEIAAAICSILRGYARRRGGFRVSVGDPGSKLRRDPDVLRGPDVAVVSAARWPAGSGVEGWLEGGPDLAVEVLGDSQTVVEIMNKALEYLSAGSKMVWIVDPRAESVMVVVPPGLVRIVSRGEPLDGGEALPGFTCNVAELFEV